MMISIHAPREGCDLSVNGSQFRTNEFQSTHPVKGATDALNAYARGQRISIHAPREGCDGPSGPGAGV